MTFAMQSVILLNSTLFVNEQPNLSHSEEDAPDNDSPNDHVQNQTERRYQEANGPQQVQGESQHNRRESQQAPSKVANESQQSNPLSCLPS